MEILLSTPGFLQRCGNNITHAFSVLSHVLCLTTNFCQLSASVREDVPLAVLKEFNIDLYSKDGNDPLHIAAVKGYTEFIKLALNRGFVNLLTYSDRNGQLLVDVALKHEHYGTAAVILREMND